jgi:hypothetical protein
LPKKTFEEAASAGVHLIAQVKDNQPTLHATVTDLCAITKPREKTRTVDKNQRLRHETRSYEVFLPRKALAGSEWNEHVACIIRVQRDTLKRSAGYAHSRPAFCASIVPRMSPTPDIASLSAASLHSSRSSSRRER